MSALPRTRFENTATTTSSSLENKNVAKTLQAGQIGRQPAISGLFACVGGPSGLYAICTLVIAPPSAHRDFAQVPCVLHL